MRTFATAWACIKEGKVVAACGMKRTKTAADHLDAVGLHRRIILNMQ